MTALVLDIVTTAAILFAVASGLLIILGVLKIVNFAHGGFLPIGGYSGLVVTQLGFNAWLAYPAAVVAGMRGYTAITGWVADVPPAILADLYLRSGAAPGCVHFLRRRFLRRSP